MRHWIALALATITIAAPAAAEDAPKRPWSDQAEVGIVATSGNAEGTNVAVSNKFKYTWSNSELTVDAAALRAESTTRTITNPAPYGTAVVSKDSNVTAENYLVAGKYRMTITDRLYWFAGTSWYRNVFAGLNGRYLAGAGIGYAVLATPRHTLKVEGGADYTHEVPLEGFDTRDFASVHGFVGYEFKISEKAKLNEDLNLFDNVQETPDWRVTSVTALTASLTDRLAVKVSYAAIYANTPQKQIVPPDPVPAPPIDARNAEFTFDKLDTIFSAALVLNF